MHQPCVDFKKGNCIRRALSQPSWLWTLLWALISGIALDFGWQSEEWKRSASQWKMAGTWEQNR
eukprot:355648-Chlamydomonas_euryale.AAC.2